MPLVWTMGQRLARKLNDEAPSGPQGAVDSERAENRIRGALASAPVVAGDSRRVGGRRIAPPGRARRTPSCLSWRPHNHDARDEQANLYPTSLTFVCVLHWLP